MQFHTAHKYNRAEPDGVSGHRSTRVRPASDAPLRSDVASLIADRSRVRLLEGLSESAQNTILAAASYRRFSGHSVVASEGEPADHLFLVIKGSARYFVITPKNSSVCVWERKTIRGLAARYPRLLENGLAIATDYLTWYLASHLGLLCHSARERLSHVLVSLANGLGTKCPDGIQLDITNEQLANTANITLFTASRLLSEWQRRGAVAKSRGRVVLRRPERLILS